ncbi:uncharacterized protein SPAPADRAFT_59490 [Spathaspora passalidarum NRRL Y-27907]|uniref:Uncharacterized protein n=1 Tax=Spathaspora passalidarum (strain NRRL Y-27907 / 11-Y1) TaxID=619300 RepID=G3AK16_SPAPN|nr:uncharacterized protein SPAPADRAFT_59490 [Spathaspora passalidarum NRRL Y-27907]EGW34067.1 hypothetical protein SPAPADRAFT_59490 [Spathaspora passalidarum NRRL Y-27907]
MKLYIISSHKSKNLSFVLVLSSNHSLERQECSSGQKLLAIFSYSGYLTFQVLSKLTTREQVILPDSLTHILAK